VAITASIVAGERERCAAAGIDDCLTKPISRERLFQIVETLAATDALPVVPPPELAGRESFLDALGHDYDLARRLIDLFLADSDRLLTDIGQSIAALDAERLQKAAHRLKGSISNFPDGPARDLAARMELAGFEGDVEGARELLPGLETEVARLRTLLPSLLEGEAAPRPRRG
jgi:CheY-like chemotaxis protein